MRYLLIAIVIAILLSGCSFQPHNLDVYFDKNGNAIGNEIFFIPSR